MIYYISFNAKLTLFIIRSDKIKEKKKIKALKIEHYVKHQKSHFDKQTVGEEKKNVLNWVKKTVVFCSGYLKESKSQSYVYSNYLLSSSISTV